MELCRWTRWRDVFHRHLRQSMMSEISATMIEPLAWLGHDRFLSDDTPGGGQCPGVIDITGRPRLLFHSLPIILAPGHWRATVHIELCEDAARRFMTLQFGDESNFTATDLARGVVRPQAVQLDHSVLETAVCQIRLTLKKAAFHGYVRFSGANVEKIDDSDVPGDI